MCYSEAESGLNAFLFHFPEEFIGNGAACAILGMCEMPFDPLFKVRIFGHLVFEVPFAVEF